MNCNLNIHSVGEPFIDGVTYPNGLIQYNYYDNGHELRLCFDRISKEEKQAVKEGNLKFGLYVCESAIFLLYSFTIFSKKNGWIEILSGDASYSFHLVPPDRRRIPPVQKGQDRATIQIFLIESCTGILKAIRFCTFSPEFTKYLHTEIHKQIDTINFDGSKHDRNCYDILTNFTTHDLFQQAIISCKGGD